MAVNDIYYLNTINRFVILSARQSVWLDTIYSSSSLMMPFRLGLPALH